MNNVEGHIDALLEKHRKLEEEIKEESMKNPGNHVHITALKREKLRIKDKISRLQGQNDDSASPEQDE